jgi:hypothetical protein
MAVFRSLHAVQGRGDLHQHITPTLPLSFLLGRLLTLSPFSPDRQAFDYYKQPKDVATYIKKEFDKRYPSDGKATSGVYHCIVGRNFAASVSYETRFYLHFRVGQENVIIFKSKDSPFDTDQVELSK